MIYLTVLIKTHHCGVGLEYLLYQVIFLLLYSPAAGSVPVVFILCSSHGPAQLLRRLAEGWHACAQPQEMCFICLPCLVFK